MNKMYFEFQLFFIREKLSLTSPTTVFMNLIVWDYFQWIGIMRTQWFRIRSFWFYRYDTDRHRHDMVSLCFDDDTIDDAMRKYRSLDQDLFPIFSDTYTDSSESDRSYFDVVESLTFFHIFCNVSIKYSYYTKKVS